MKKIIYTKPDGGVVIITPAPKEHLELVLGPLTDAEYEAHVMQRSIPADATNVRQIDEVDIPASREFRDAWSDITALSSIDIDCDKAKDIALAVLRKKRKPQLEALDSEFMIALETGADTTVIAAKRQALRDITNTLKTTDFTGKVNDTVSLDLIRSEKAKLK